jgi:hypothetical protein
VSRIRIEISTNRLKDVKGFSQEKQAHKEKLRTTSRRQSSFSEADVQFIGTLGEVALCQYLGTSPEFNLYSKGDKYDVLYRNHRIEIKTSTTPELKMYQYNAEKTCLNTDLLVALILDKSTKIGDISKPAIVWFTGYIPTALFFYRALTIGRTIVKPNYTTYSLAEEHLWMPQTLTNLDSR